MVVGVVVPLEEAAECLPFGAICMVKICEKILESSKLYRF